MQYKHKTLSIYIYIYQCKYAINARHLTNSFTQILSHKQSERCPNRQNFHKHTHLYKSQRIENQQIILAVLPYDNPHHLIKDKIRWKSNHVKILYQYTQNKLCITVMINCTCNPKKLCWISALQYKAYIIYIKSIKQSIYNIIKYNTKHTSIQDVKSHQTRYFQLP